MFGIEYINVSTQGVADRKTRNHVEAVFRKLDLNQDGVITLEEFIESCLKVSTYLFVFFLLLREIIIKYKYFVV